MNSNPEKAKGWKGQSFTFGNGSTEQTDLTDERDLAASVVHHIDEIALGGYRAELDLDALDAN